MGFVFEEGGGLARKKSPHFDLLYLPLASQLQFLTHEITISMIYNC